MTNDAIERRKQYEKECAEKAIENANKNNRQANMLNHKHGVTVNYITGKPYTGDNERKIREFHDDYEDLAMLTLNQFANIWGIKMWDETIADEKKRKEVYKERMQEAYKHFKCRTKGLWVRVTTGRYSYNIISSEYCNFPEDGQIFTINGTTYNAEDIANMVPSAFLPWLEQNKEQIESKPFVAECIDKFLSKQANNALQLKGKEQTESLAIIQRMQEALKPVVQASELPF